MNAVLLFSAYMAFIYMPWDIFVKPVAEDQEVWFGVLFTGWAAKATAPLHWLVYAAATRGLWLMKRWMHPWAALYVCQVVIGMFVFNLLDERGMGVTGGLVSAVPFAVLAVAFWRSREQFQA
jgi:hypothetical protein